MLQRWCPFCNPLAVALIRRAPGLRSPPSGGTVTAPTAEHAILTATAVGIRSGEDVVTGRSHALARATGWLGETTGKSGWIAPVRLTDDVARLDARTSATCRSYPGRHSSPR